MGTSSTSPKRVLMGRLYHETHSFVAGTTGLEDFSFDIGDALLKTAGDGSTLDGALEVARECGWQVIPSVDMRAMPAGTVADEVVEVWWQHLSAALNEALKTGLDGISLALHGAMVSESFPDVEGELLRRIREVTGPGIPITGPTDLHANFTPLMAEFSDALVTYHENPHTDARETAVRAARILDRLMREGKNAQTYFAQPPLLWAPTVTGTADEPMRSLEVLAREIEAADEDVLAVNIHAGYSFADIPHTGPAFSINTLGSAEKAQEYLQQLNEQAVTGKAWSIHLDPEPPTVFDRIEAEKLVGKEPIILVEPSDNIGAGAPGDGTGLLREFLQRRIANSGVIINDPETVAQLAEQPLGSRHRVSIGGKHSPIGGAPIEAEVEILSLSDGTFELEDRHSHAAASGVHINMGPSAVVHVALDESSDASAPNTRGIIVLLTSYKTAPFDLGQWRSQGIEPSAFDFIAVKAAVAHRQAYNKISSTSFNVNTPGPCSSDLRSLPFKQVRRPIYPLDEI